MVRRGKVFSQNQLIFLWSSRNINLKSQLGHKQYPHYEEVLPHTVEIKEIFLSPKKIFRQITYLEISLVKMLLSPNFLPKRGESKFP